MVKESYPVWYIEAKPAGAAPRMGSAVVVRLRKVGDPSPGRKVLLTCGHVVRGSAADGEDGWGPVLDDLLVWAPGKGYTRVADTERRQPGSVEGALRVNVWPGWGGGVGEVPADRRSPAADWIVLDVADPSFQDQACVRTLSEPNRSGLRVVGFPAGSQAWKAGDLVEAVVAGDFNLQDSDQGIVRTTGSETRPGMSGGGLFNADGGFVGLHRSRTDAALKQHAIAATYLRDQFIAMGWDVVETPIPVIHHRWRYVGAAAGVLAVGTAVALMAIPGPPAQATIAATVREFVYDPNGVIEESRPLAGAKVGLLFDNREAPDVQGGDLNASGKTTLAFQVARAELGKQLKVHFLIDMPETRPASGPSSGPFVTTTWGAVRNGDSTTTLREGYPLPIGTAEIPVSLTVIPWSEKSRYYYLSDALSAGLQKSANKGGTRDLKADLDEAAKDLGLKDKEVIAKARRAWAEKMAAKTPAFAIASPLLRDKASPEVQKAADAAAPSVCFVTCTGDASGWSRTGFVIADNLVVTTRLSDKDRFASIGFAARGGEGTTLPVEKTVLLPAKLKLAFLSVQKLPAPKLPLAGSYLFDAEEPAQVAVLAYAAVTQNSPEEVRDIVLAGGPNQKRIMPGSALAPARAPGEAALQYDSWTSTGCEGGPVIDLNTLRVLGVHLAGQWEGAKRNTAISISDMLKDPEIDKLLKNAKANTVTPRQTMMRTVLPQASGYAPGFLGATPIPMPLPRDPSRILKHEAGSVVNYEHLSVVLDKQRALALCAACNVDRKQIKTVQQTSGIRYFLDPRIPEQDQISNLYGPGQWDKGQLIPPSAVAWGSQAEAESAYGQAFAYPNVCPQQPAFNRNSWRRLQDYVFTKLQPDATRLSVFSGPVLDPKDPQRGGVRIPREFWMVAVLENASKPAAPSVHAWIVAQFEATDDEVFVPLQMGDPKTTEALLSKVEERTGLLFHGIPGAAQ